MLGRFLPRQVLVVHQGVEVSIKGRKFVPGNTVVQLLNSSLKIDYILVQIYMQIDTANTNIYTNQYSKYEYLFANTYMHFAGAYVFFLFLSRAFLVI